MRYFDLHCDTASVCCERNLEPDNAALAAAVNKGNLFSEWYQCYAVFINDNSTDPQLDYNNIIPDFPPIVNMKKW